LFMRVLVAMRVQGWSSVAWTQVSLFDPQVVADAAGLTGANADLHRVYRHRLMRLPESIRTLVLAEKLSEGHARALLGLETEERMLRLAERVQAERLSVRKTEELVRDELAEPRESPEVKAMPQEVREDADRYREISRRLQDALTLPTRVRPSRKGGRVEIRFREKEELDALVALLTADSVENSYSTNKPGLGR